MMDDRVPLLRQEFVPQTFQPVGLFWNIVKSFAGAGTFALPWAIMNAGLYGGIVGIILIALLSNFTIRTLLTCGERVMEIRARQNISGIVTPPTYPDIGRAVFGEPGAQTISLFSACMCFGVCIAYFALIGGNIVELLAGPMPNLKSWEIIIVILPICIFLSCLTDLTKLAYTSVAGSIALLIAMGAVIIYGLSEHKISQDYSVFEWKTLPLFLGGAAFLFIDHVILVPLANSCGNYKRFPRILDYAMVFVTVVNIIFASMSYVYWNTGTCGSVISNLPEGSVVGDIVRVGISLEVLASFPLVASAGFQAVEAGFHLERVRAFPYSPPGEPHPFFSRNLFYYIFRGGLIATLALVASAVKNFGILVSLVGSLTIASTGFVFPQVFYIKLFQKQLRTYEYVVQGLIICFGIGMTVLGTYQSIQSIVDPGDGC